MRPIRWLLLLACVGVVGCAEDTSRLPPELAERLTAEGVVHRADNQVFRYTHDVGTRSAGWEDRLASIVVTPQTVLIHKNGKIGIEVHPRSRRFYEVRRTGGRVLIRAGSGGAAETWSFEPPDDADGWTRAIRSVIRASRSVAND